MVVVSTFNLINEKEKERSARGAVPGDAGGALSAQPHVRPHIARVRVRTHLRNSYLAAQGFYNSIEISVIAPSAPVTNPRMQYLRSPSLPAYENLVSEQRTKNIETPPPSYDETVNKFDYV